LTYTPNALALSGNNLFVAWTTNSVTRSSTVAEYDATTGALINPNFITGLYNADGLAVYGNNLFVVWGLGTGRIGEYDATTGAVVNANFIKGLSDPWTLTVSGNTLFVANYGPNTVYEYDATTGALIKPINTGGEPFGVAASGNNLLVCATSTSLGVGTTVSEYNATTGASINPNFITGLVYEPFALAVSGNNLLVEQGESGAEIQEYNATTGALINANFITGLISGINSAFPFYGNAIAVSPAPTTAGNPSPPGNLHIITSAFLEKMPPLNHLHPQPGVP
jgi:YVTN family beta-propeller protein